jgi:hypothetical protein
MNILTKTALAAALVLAALTTAQAKDDFRDEPTGGYHIGPLGQYFGGPVYRSRGYRGYYGYGYAPRYYRHRHWRYGR